MPDLICRWTEMILQQSRLRFTLLDNYQLVSVLLRELGFQLRTPRSAKFAGYLNISLLS